MNVKTDHRHNAALDWIVRTNDPDFDAWDMFTDWLEEDSANADAYHRLAGSEMALRPMVEAATVSNDAAQPLPTTRPLRRMAIAASLALLAATGLIAPRLMPTDYSTAAGEIRTVSLGGADQLVMNGGTKVTLSGFDRRHVRLDQGQIFLRLADAGKGQVDVHSGDLRLVDVGTQFEVSRDGRSTRVLVSEGVVMADPGGAGLRLSVGQRLDTQDGATLLRAEPADPNSAGAFERGQLLYSDALLDHVVFDLRLSTGIDFSTSEGIRTQRFSGTLSVADVKRDPRSLAPLLGVAMRKSKRGWALGVPE